MGRTPLLLVALAVYLGARAAAQDAAAPQADARPRIAFDRTEHDFGTARQQTEYRTEFVLRNEGGAPLHVDSVRGDCGCSQVAIDRNVVEPGGTAKVSVLFRTYTFVGALTKHVHVRSDDPDRPEIDLRVRIDVSAGVVATPANFFFNTVLVGSRPTASLDVKWKEGVGRPFKITGIEAVNVRPAGLEMAFDTKPMDAPPWHGYTVTVSFPKPPPVGMVTATALLRTDDPDVPRIQALVGGNVSGRVQIALLRPSFGVVTEGKGAKLSVRVRPFDATVDLGTVTASARKGAVQAKAVRDDKTPGEWVVEIVLPEKAPPGVVEDVVEVQTAVKGEERTDLPVTGTVTHRPS